MDRLPVVERAHWPDLAAAYGLALSNGAGRPLWRESAYWRFSADEVAERLTAPAAALERMGYAAVEYALGSDTLLRRLGIPEYLWDTLTNSWRSRHKHLAGRFDLAYDGHSPPRLLGYEADAPAGLAEAALFQASWLKGRGFGQFNAIAEALGVALKEFGIGRRTLYFAARREGLRDAGSLRLLMDAAVRAGLETRFVGIEELSLDGRGHFADSGNQPISFLYAREPWHRLMGEPFARFISGQATQWIEPPWTMILAGKGLLPVLWEMHPGHPLLLPAWFADDPRAERAGMPLVAAAPRGLGGLVVHASPPLPEVGRGGHAVTGLWMVAGRPAGLAVREISRDGHMVTVPHGVV